MAETRSALIVASSSYDDATLRQLIAPAEDAQALANALGDPKIGGFEIHTNIDQPSYAICAAIEEFLADRRTEDLIVLYFTGHGIKDEDGELFFAAKNTQLVNHQLRRSSAVSAGFINEAMQRCRSRRQVLLLDCCYSGAFARGMATKGGASVDSKDRFEGRGRLVLTASDAMQYSFEGEEVQGKGARSLFTSALVQGLCTGQADRDQDGLVSLDELYDYVYDQLSEMSPAQRPMKIGYMEGKLYIGRNPIVKVAALPSELQRAIASEWPQVRLSAVRELGRLLGDANRGMAEAAWQALAALVEDDSRQVSQAAAAAAIAAGKQLEPGAGPASGPAAAPQPASPARQQATSAAEPERQRPAADDPGDRGEPRNAVAPAPSPETESAKDRRARIAEKYSSLFKEDRIYFLGNIPAGTLKNAYAVYAHRASLNSERPLCLVDDSAFGSGKVGCLVTNEAVYYKPMFEKGAMIPWSEIREAQPEGIGPWKILRVNSVHKLEFGQSSQAATSLFSEMLLELAGKT